MTTLRFKILQNFDIKGIFGHFNSKTKLNLYYQHIKALNTNLKNKKSFSSSARCRAGVPYVGEPAGSEIFSEIARLALQTSISIRDNGRECRGIKGI